MNPFWVNEQCTLSYGAWQTQIPTQSWYIAGPTALVSSRLEQGGCRPFFPSVEAGRRDGMDNLLKSKETETQKVSAPQFTYR